MLPPPHARSLGLESNMQNGCFRAAVLNSALKYPVCACDGCVDVKAVPANLWQATSPWDLGTDIPLALVWVSKMMDRSVRGQTVAVKCANVVSASCLPSCVCLGFDFYFIFLLLRSQICVATCFAVTLTISTAFRPICNHKGLTSCPNLVKLFQNLTTFHALKLETCQYQEERGWEGGKAGWHLSLV